MICCSACAPRLIAGGGAVDHAKVSWHGRAPGPGGGGTRRPYQLCANPPEVSSGASDPSLPVSVIESRESREKRAPSRSRRGCDFAASFVSTSAGSRLTLAVAPVSLAAAGGPSLATATAGNGPEVRRI